MTVRKDSPWRTTLAALVAGLVGVALLPAATIVETCGPFTVTYYNNGDTDATLGLTGVQNWTLQQRQDVAATIATWDYAIADVQGRQINLHAFWQELDGYGVNVLGGASGFQAYNGTTVWELPELIWRDGVNFANPYPVDIWIQYDVTAGNAPGGWNFGSGNPAGNQVDFRSVNTHEIGHPLGFSGTYNSGTDTFGYLSPSVQNAGLTVWESYLRDSTNNQPVSGGTGAPGNFNEVDDPVYWVGPVTMAVYGGPVPIYAPASYSAGSSLVHWDEGTLPTTLMSPSLSGGQVARSPLPIEWTAMTDMGWNIVIPEPATVLLLVLPLALAGCRRRT